MACAIPEISSSRIRGRIGVAGVRGFEQLGGGAGPLPTHAAARGIQLEAATPSAWAERTGRVVHEVTDLAGHAPRAVA